MREESITDIEIEGRYETHLLRFTEENGWELFDSNQERVARFGCYGKKYDIMTYGWIEWDVLKIAMETVQRHNGDRNC